MSIQRYDDEGYGPCNPDPDGPWVRYADHLAEMGRVRRINDTVARGYSEAMRAACIASVLAYADDRQGRLNVPTPGDDIAAALRVAADRLREVQP